MKFHDVWSSICNHYSLDSKRFKVEFQYETQKEYQERVDHGLQVVFSGIVNGNIDVTSVGEEGLPDVKGRITECRIYDNDNVIARGESHCCDSDNFVRVEGRRYAFKRAYDEFKKANNLVRPTIGS